MDYNELKSQFKLILHYVSKDEIRRWLEEDEKRVEVERRTGKTERLLDIAVDKAKEFGIIYILNNLQSYGAPYNWPAFLDKNPKDFLRKFCKKFGNNSYHDEYILKIFSTGTVYVLKRSLLKDYEKWLFLNNKVPAWCKENVLLFSNYRDDEMYAIDYLNFIDSKAEHTIYIEDGVDFKATCMDYIKIVK